MAGKKPHQRRAPAPGAKRVAAFSGQLATFSAGVVAAVVATVIGAWVIAEVPRPPLLVIATAVLTVILALVFAISPSGSKLRPSALAVVLLAVSGTSVYEWVTRPSAVERRVADYVSSICRENFWLDDSAVCYPQAEELLVERFSAFDPDEWHRWDELADATPVPAGRLSADAPGLAGLPIAVAGRVLAVQKLGASQQVIQVRPMTVQESAAFLASPEFAGFVANEANRTSLAATPVRQTGLRHRR